MNGEKRPKVSASCTMQPMGPFISTGAVSFKYFGQSTENNPHAKPYINLPRYNKILLIIPTSSVIELRKHIAEPSITSKLEI